MNVVYLSPGFPPTAADFCHALAARGVRVLGIGDQELRPDGQAARALASYVLEPRMAEHQPLHDALLALRERFGPIDRVESNGEHWLAAEARLREDFDIPGLKSHALAERRSKLAMAEIFGRAKIPHPATLPAADATGVRQLAADHGFPLVFKPDVGSGAVDTFTVSNAGELDVALERHLDAHVVQPFIDGEITTYDGLVDAQGRVIFSTSHVYDTGIMQVRRGGLDGHYYSLRELPPELEALGRRTVAAFELRERFFHIEFIQRPGKQLVALEVNLRPPGGFTTDMMSTALEEDVYALWARLLIGEDLTGLRFERKYHTAHAGRRAGHLYRLDDAELRQALGSTLVTVRPIPPAFADTMGDMAYLLRHPDLDELKRAIALVQKR